MDQSCGTNKRSVAQSILKRIEGEIERGEYRLKVRTPPTFLSAALAYLEAGRRKRYVAKLIRYFGETPLDEIDQAAIDEAAVALHPNAGAGARNAAVYTPMSAILHHAGDRIKIRRPRAPRAESSPTGCDRKMPTPSSSPPIRSTPNSERCYAPCSIPGFALAKCWRGSGAT